MSGYELTANGYRTLYERYFKRLPEDLLRRINGDRLDGLILVDLCAGGGRLTRTAHSMGAKLVLAIDGSPTMLKDLDEERYSRTQVLTWAGPFNALTEVVRQALQGTDQTQVDAVVCQQGINHVFSENLLNQVSRILKPGGKFIFNTFNKRPADGPNMTQYEYNGAHFAEITYMCDDTVHHTQIRKGRPPHHTEFQWIPPNQFKRMLHRYFRNVERITEGSTDIYICK